jgi:peptidoglycan hydrolase CwlO-like protein
MNKSLTKSFIALFLTAVLIVLQWAPAKAISVSDLQKQKAYQEALVAQKAKDAAAKQKQAAALKDQINYVADQIDSTQDAVTTTSGQILGTEKTIADLELQIIERESEIDRQKEKMSDVISSWYMEGNSGLLEAVVGANSLNDVISQKQYYDSIRQQLQASIEQVNALKTELETEKSAKDSTLAQLSDLKNNQVSQMGYLQDRKSLKNRLLTDTNAAVTQLESEKKAAQAYASQLQSKIDAISASYSSGGDVIQGSNSWYYSQNDPAWGSHRIGRYATIGQIGCFLTSLTMVAKHAGVNITPLSAANNSSFDTSGGGRDGSLYSFPYTTYSRDIPIDWNVVNREIDAGRPIILGVSIYSRSGQLVSFGQPYSVSHYVVAYARSDGKYIMNDPWALGRSYGKGNVKTYRTVSVR